MLTDIEISIIKLICKGLDNNSIANTISLPYNQVKVLVSVILKKMNVRNKTHLAFVWGQHESKKLKNK